MNHPTFSSGLSKSADKCVHDQGYEEPQYFASKPELDAMMTDDERFNILRCQALSLMQALLGVISANYRKVWIEWKSDSLLIGIVLEKESEEDKDEIEELWSEFEALQSANLDFKIEVSVSNEMFCGPTMHSSNCIIVFQRKES